MFNPVAITFIKRTFEKIRRKRPSAIGKPIGTRSRVLFCVNNLTKLKNET